MQISVAAIAALKLEIRAAAWAYADLALNGFSDVLLEHKAGISIDAKLVDVARAGVVNT